MVILAASYGTSNTGSCIKSRSLGADFSQALHIGTKQCLLRGEGQYLPRKWEDQLSLCLPWSGYTDRWWLGGKNV